LNLQQYPMKENIRILIADDHPFFTEGVVNALRSSSQYKIVATPHRGDEVIAAVKEHSPDIVLLDVNMPGKDGIELSRGIKEQWPVIKVILLTMYLPSDIQIHPEDELIDGYILKNSGTDILLFALEEVSKGGRFFDSDIRRTNQHSNDNFTSRLKLSTREKEILQLLIAGHLNKEIAARLFLSEMTIKTHRKNIMSKLDAHNLADLVRKSK
jgi:DNA-binding NarL/FixJ family response regulator